MHHKYKSHYIIVDCKSSWLLMTNGEINPRYIINLKYTNVLVKKVQISDAFNHFCLKILKKETQDISITRRAIFHSRVIAEVSIND